MIAEASRRRIRVFLSSPSDVVAHRVRAGQIVLKLAREFSYHFDVEPVLWERQPLRATGHFQDEIIPPRQTGITVVVLWGKLGTSLPEDQFSGAVSGKRPVTGTEWEFEDAFAGYQARQRPHLLVYRCLDRIPVDLNDEDAVVRGQAGKRQVEEFMRRWFLNDSDQTLKAAFHPFITLTEFEEKLESNLRDLLRQEAGNALGEVTGIRWHESPYRGLGVFDVQHAPIFFGRTRARNELLQCLSQRISSGTVCVLVLGASGSGKSSLVRAGLIPDLLAGEVIPHLGLCRFALLKPSDAANPVAALAESLFRLHALPELAGLSYTASSLAELLEQAPAQAVLPIRQGLEQAARTEALADHAIARLVIGVDQFEELFTLDSIGAAQREHFARVLDALARSGLVWVIATLRSDFFDRLETLPQLAQLTDGGRYLVLPPDSAELGQIIRQPAREGGVRFERSEQAGISLDDRILVQAQKSPGALPLLEFLLDELWKQRTDSGLLTFAAFDSLGGLEGAIGRRAEEEFQLLPAEVQQAFPEVLRELVTVGDEGIATSRPAAMSRFIPGTPQREAVDAFLRPETRLLVGHSDDQSRPQVRLTHEALLTHWERARAQIEQDKTDLQTRARLETAAHRWRSKEQDEDLLLPAGIQLSEAADLLQRREQMLDAPTQAYIAASTQAEVERRLAQAEKDRREIEDKAQMERRLHEEEQIRLTEQAASAHRIKRRTQVAAVLLSLIAAVAIWAGWRARTAELSANRQAALSAFSASAAATEKGQWDIALARLAHAIRLDPSNRNVALSAMLSLDLQEWTSLRVDLLEQEGGIKDLAMNGDGTRALVLLEEKIAQLREVRTGRLVGKPLPHEDSIERGSFGPDSSKVLIVTKDNWGHLWDGTSGAKLGEPLRFDTSSVQAEFSADGALVLTVFRDNTVRLWNANTGASMGVSLPHDSAVSAASFSPDSTKIVTASGEVAQIWDAKSGTLLGPPFRREWMFSAEFSPDGKKILTGATDHTARVWDAMTGDPLGEPMRHDSFLTNVDFSPDGTRILTASASTESLEMTVRLWDAATGTPIGPPQRADGVSFVAFSQLGTHLLTVESDETSKLWRLPISEPEDDDSLTDFLGVAAGLTVSENGTTVPLPNHWNRVGKLRAEVAAAARAGPPKSDLERIMRDYLLPQPEPSKAVAPASTSAE